MTKHLTVRMAWHDNEWNGRVCEDPESNWYCSGTHSLLSERIARRKNVELEQDNATRKISMLEDYTPPCFWSCNAFSEHEYRIEHVHPFENVEVEPIKDTLKPNSVYTWPFRLSFNHSKKIRKIWGTYPPPKVLERRINDFFNKLKVGKTIIFFYLNYDNPISANDTPPKYVLLGCSVLTDIGAKPHYEFDPGQLNHLRGSSVNMKNFPTLRWAVQLSHDFENSGILLPYHEYLKRIDEFPEEEERLQEMQVLIDEETIIPNFKYVAAHLDEDKCLYLLYKIKKSLHIIDDHGFVDVDKEKRIIEKLIRESWKRRGLYPSLGKILDLIADIEADEEPIGDRIVSRVREHCDSTPKLIDLIFDLIINEQQDVPDFLDDLSSDFEELRSNIAFHKDRIDLLKKLSLFTLTAHQLKRIIFQKDNPFKKPIDAQQILKNPYLIAENYVSGQIDLDEPEIADGPIDVSKIDIGMLPDRRYVKQRNRKLQNFVQRSPERLRAIIIDYLKAIGKDGDCYATLDGVYDAIISYPIFYKEELNINKPELADKHGVYYSHFNERLEILENNGESFLYLNEVRYAEQLVKQLVLELLNRTDYDVETDWIGDYVDTEAKELAKEVPNFKEKQFREERTRLLTNVLQKSFFIISGKPGTGKTFVLEKIIPEMRRQGETVTLMAPTGKATLRLKELTKFKEAQTIDMYLHREGYSDFLDDFENILIKTIKKKRIDNLIIDETSMVDLQKLAILFSIVDSEGPYQVKRIILVGDEKQLPPIGFGKPFIDIIDFVKSSQGFKHHYIRLKTNCRQQLDETILELADLFADKDRYYEEILDKIYRGGQISPGLKVERWKNQEELDTRIDKGLLKVVKDNLKEQRRSGIKNKAKGLNLLFGLYDNGSVKENSTRTIELDRLQVLSPYRAGYFGTLGLNELIKSEYREEHYQDRFRYLSSPFNHAEKIIRINNEYVYYGGKKRLRLSNGSIGVINNKTRKLFGKNVMFRRYYFLDQEKPIDWIDDEDNFELSYAITIHKSQGSDFQEIFTVIPQKPTLLSKELMYTALTRSKGKVTLFLQETKESNPLEVARGRSFVLARNTSIFEDPEDRKGIYEPEKGVFVKSKIEYILYTALQSRGISFEYERTLPLKEKSYTIHPDFAIDVDGRTYYWEHLGILDMKDYYKDWEKRKQDYIDNGYYEHLITTDDLNGASKEIIDKIIQDILKDNLTLSDDERFSKHHYTLYP